MSAMNQDSLSALLRSGSCIMLHILTYTKKKGKAEFQNCYRSYQLTERNLLPAQGGHHWYLCPARPGLAPAFFLATQTGNN